MAPNFVLVLLLCLLTLSALAQNTSERVHNHQHVRSHAHKSLEAAIRTYDRDILQSALALMDSRSIEIRGFYHVSTVLPHWQEVLEEHLMVMDGKRFTSNLFAARHSRKGAGGGGNSVLSTGWSSILDIVESVQVTFEPSDGTEASVAYGRAAYSNMTYMISSLQLRNAAKLNVKAYDEPHSKGGLGTGTAAATATATGTGTGASGVGGGAGTGGAGGRTPAIDVLDAILGELHAMGELLQYCLASHTEGRQSWAFLMHNQENSCSGTSTSNSGSNSGGSTSGSNSGGSTTYSNSNSHTSTNTNSGNSGNSGGTSTSGSSSPPPLQDHQDAQTFVSDPVNAFPIEFPSVCMLAMLGGYATCGTDFDSNGASASSGSSGSGGGGGGGGGGGSGGSGGGSSGGGSGGSGGSSGSSGGGGGGGKDGGYVGYGSYSSNIWWANCAHIATLQPLHVPIKNVKTTAITNIPLAIQQGRDLIANFLYHRGGSWKVGAGKGADKGKPEAFRDRCAFNVHTGTHVGEMRTVQGGVERVLESTCVRTEYRLSLIDVLASLHDNSQLHNRRARLPTLVTPLYMKEPPSHSELGCFEA